MGKDGATTLNRRERVQQGLNGGSIHEGHSRQMPVYSGRIRVKILGEGELLPSDLQAVVDAADADSFIEGKVLIDLCKQRSGQRGSGCDAPAEADELPVLLVSGCDAPAEAKELPVPLASPPTMPALQVRQYSWHHYARNDVSDKRREFVGTNKQTNHGSPFLLNRNLSSPGFTS